MANEYRVYKLGSEVIHDGTPVSRLYSVSSHVIHDGNPTQPVRLFAIRSELIRDLRDRFDMAQTTNPNAGVFGGFEFSAPFTWAPIGGDNSPFDSTFSYTELPFTIENRERNPYPSAYVAVDLDEQQRTIREQHNGTQAGDSTFDYGLLLQGTPEKLYTLGSLGRFYHDDFGLIHGRYVQFGDWVVGAIQGCPVGRYVDSPEVDWIVTNDFSKSGPELVMGVCCIAESPAKGTYGWIVVDGPNPALIGHVDGILPAPDTPYTWVGTGQLGIGVAGKVVGRRWGKAKLAAISRGTLYVRIEAFSPASLSQLILDEVQETLDKVEEHETRLTTVEGKVTTLEEGANDFQTSVGALTLRIATEEAKRARDDAQIRSLLGATDWSTEITASANTVRAEFQAADQALGVRIAAAQYTADQALAGIPGDLSGLAGQITALTGVVESVNSKILSFAVDMITTPPTDAQALIYDAAVEKWIPGDVAPTAGATVPAGVAFPVGPVLNDRFYRTDRKIEYVWDGTRWLSTQLFTLNTDLAASVTADHDPYVPVPYLGVYGIWLERFSASVYRTAAGEWDVRLIWRNAANAGTVVATLDGAGDANATWVARGVNINAVLDVNARVLDFGLQEISGAANFFGAATLHYRLIG